MYAIFIQELVCYWKPVACTKRKDKACSSWSFI